MVRGANHVLGEVESTGACVLYSKHSDPSGDAAMPSVGASVSPAIKDQRRPTPSQLPPNDPVRFPTAWVMLRKTQLRRRGQRISWDNVAVREGVRKQNG